MSTFDPDVTIVGMLPDDSTDGPALDPSKAKSGSSDRPRGYSDSAPSQASQPHVGVELVRGTRPGLDDETQELLHQRLRAAVVVLFIAVFTFWIRSFFLDDAPIQWLQAIVSAGLIASLGVLSSGRSWSLHTLRRAEVGLFWSATLFLCLYQYILLRHKAHTGDAAAALGAIKSCVIYFFGVIILYGTFIPNRWQRAVKVVGPMALASGIAPLILRFFDSDMRAISSHIATFEQVSDNILMLALGVLTSAYGTHIINTLREEVYRARQLGQYRLKELLGKGGMGEVYLAEHRLLKRKCAIKLIRSDQQADPQALVRFEREVRTTARLSHPNTIDVYDYGRTEDGTFFYVMEFLPGLNLAEIVRRFGPLSAPRAVCLLTQACGALREAHEVGLIHRDIKPANIFAAQRGGRHDIAKLLDFGLVRMIKRAVGMGSAESTEESPVEHGLSGSIHFMAPEQADPDKQVDQRSDIYSLGATAYFLVTGEPPFVRENGIQVLHAHAHDAVIPPSQLSSQVPHDLEAIILKCLEKSPDDRYPTVEALEEALHQCSLANQWNAEDARKWWEENGVTSIESSSS